MDLQQRIDVLVGIGKYMQSGNAFFEASKEKARLANQWFTNDFINLSVSNIAHNFLQREKLETWVRNYSVNEKAVDAKTVGIVMAGNIPLVGFHDLICVFLSGHHALIKPSSKDDVLIKHLVQKMNEQDIPFESNILLADMLKGCNAYIATGSNNSARYFDFYFGKYPSIIRRNRTSVAILDGTETGQELQLLADDIQLYFGLGCRNITKLFVPKGYNFVSLLDALKKYEYFTDFHKYKNNYDYQLALLIMNNKFYMSNESILLTENESVFSPVSQVNYEFFEDKISAINCLQNNNDIQCIVGHNYTNFGQAQSPALNDYADGRDTMEFLCGL